MIQVSQEEITRLATNKDHIRQTQLSWEAGGLSPDQLMKG